MKNIKIKLFALTLGISMLISTGCKKGLGEFGDINTNPNLPSQPSPAGLLTNVLSTIGGNVWGNAITTNAGLYAQYTSETQYTDASRYAKQTIGWDGYYSGSMYDLQTIINYNTDEATKVIAQLYGSNANQIATARILLAYFYMILTDTYGDLPYFEALKNNAVIPFDKQEDIYPAIINELKAAVAQFDAGAGFQGDILYGGSTAKWKKFANSLRAIMALRMSKANAALGATEFAAAIADGVMTSNADNACIVYPGGNYRNPIYNYYVITQRFDYAVSQTITDQLKAYNDPRLLLFGDYPDGFPYGLSRDDAIDWANSNDYAFLYAFTATPQDYPMCLITAGQTYLARAEAAKLGWTAEVAATMYINGITAEMERWEVDPVDIAAYVAQPSILLTGVNDLEKIGIQRWLSHYPDGNQGWAEWRRTGYPDLTPAPGAGKEIPRRFPYGPNELLYNPTNTSDAASRYVVGGVSDSQDGRVWWDKP